MSRHVELLTGDVVEELPEPCRSCLFWELGGAWADLRLVRVAGGGGAGGEPAADALVRKEAWVSARVQEGMPPGRVVRVDGEIAAHAVFAPSDGFGRRPWPVPPASSDAVLLAMVWVQPDRRDHGLGRLLLQAAIRDAIRVGARAVEAYGDRRWRDRNCLLPVTWLLHEGFVVHREHPRTPLLRLDVKRTVRWAESLEHAWEEVLERLPRRVPAPATDGLPGRMPTATGRPPAAPRRRGPDGPR